MPISAFVEDIEQVEETLREEYVPVESGGYRLKALEGFVPEDKVTEHESVKNLKSALDKERESRKDYERKLKEQENSAHKMSDEEKEELSALREAKEKAEEARRRREGEFDKWRDEIKSSHTKEIQSIVGERDQLKQSLCEDRVSREITAACNELGGRAVILEPLIRKAVEAEYSEGRVDIHVKDPDGTNLLDENGKALTIAGYVQRMSEAKEFADLFASRQKSGGGSSSDAGGDAGGEGGGEKPSNLKRSEMSKTEKVAYIREHGPDAFHALPA